MTRSGSLAATAVAREYGRHHVLVMTIITVLAVGAAGEESCSGRRRVVRAVLLAAVVVAVFAQSGWLLRSYNPTVSASLFYPHSQTERTVAQLTGRDTTLHLRGAAFWPDANLWYELPSPSGYDAIGVRSYDKLAVRALGKAPSENELRPAGAQALRVLGIRWVVTTGDEPAVDGPEHLEQVWAKPPVKLYRVPGSPDRYFTVSRAVAVPTDDAAVDMMTRPGFEINTTVVLRQPAGASRPTPSAMPDPGNVAVVREGPTSVRLTVRRPDAGWVVFLRSRYPGWQASVNGKGQALLAADAAFSAVQVPAGVSIVDLRYDSAVVRLGVLVSLASLLGLATLAAIAVVTSLPRRRGRRLRVGAAPRSEDQQPP